MIETACQFIKWGVRLPDFREPVGLATHSYCVSSGCSLFQQDTIDRLNQFLEIVNPFRGRSKSKIAERVSDTEVIKQTVSWPSHSTFWIWI